MTTPQGILVSEYKPAQIRRMAKELHEYQQGGELPTNGIFREFILRIKNEGYPENQTIRLAMGTLRDHALFVLQREG